MLNSKTYDTHLRLHVDTKKQINEICMITHFNPAAVIGIAVNEYYNAYMERMLLDSDPDKEA